MWCGCGVYKNASSALPSSKGTGGVQTFPVLRSLLFYSTSREREPFLQDTALLQLYVSEEDYSSMKHNEYEKPYFLSRPS